MFSKLKNNKASFIVSIVWVLISVVEIIVAFSTIGRRGIDSYFITETGIISLLALSFIIFMLIEKLIKKKSVNKLLLISAVLILISMLVVFAQFLPPSLGATMPYRYLTMGKVYGFIYRVDLLQGEAIPETVLSLRSSNYVINLNIILSIIWVVFNTIYYVKRNKNYDAKEI